MAVFQRARSGDSAPPTQQCAVHAARVPTHLRDRVAAPGVAVEVVQTLLGHSSVVTTSQTYAHIKVEDARAALERVGWFDRQETGR